MSYPVPYRKTSQSVSTRLDVDRRLFIMPDSRCAPQPGSGILLRRSWSVSLVLILYTFGCMIILLYSWIFSIFAGAVSSSKVTLPYKYISAVVCILLVLVQPGFGINFLTKLLVSNFMLFPAGAPRQILSTHWSFQVVHHLVSPRFDVVSCPGFLVLHVALLCPVRTLYPCDQKYPVGSHGGL